VFIILRSLKRFGRKTIVYGCVLIAVAGAALQYQRGQSRWGGR
jgi:hypothetical protein